MKRYKNIIDDYQAFEEARDNKQIISLRRNDIKTEKEFFESELSKAFDFEKAGWNDKIYRLKNDVSPGKNWLHWRGEYYVQEESATIPVTVLDPEPGDNVLDMCSAPGGKTTQIADEIDNKGIVVANDDSSRRLQSLHANVYRTGSTSVKVINKDGRQIKEDFKFDKILVDAPCTGEGDRYRRNFKAANEEESLNLSKLQKQLLEKAEKLLKSGGRIVYSTCTINPIENEKVVSEVTKNSSLSIESIDLDIGYQKGVREYKDLEFAQDVEKTARILPHHIGSGVIYVAKLKKEE